MAPLIRNHGGGQLHAPVALTPGNTPVSIECDALLAPDVQVDRRIRG